MWPPAAVSFEAITGKRRSAVTLVMVGHGLMLQDVRENGHRFLQL